MPNQQNPTAAPRSPSWVPVRKIKAVALGTVAAAAAGAAAYLTGVDWSALGPWGPAIGAAAVTAVGYLVRPGETDGPV